MADISHLGSGEATDYTIGDYDQRPWGFWLVTDVKSKSRNNDYCEKVIVVSPGKILSLQSHKLRNEKWTVLDGTLVTIIDGQSQTLKCGDSIDVPSGALHSMANLGDTACIIKEQQTGICRESDITRYLDAYGRSTGGDTDDIAPSIALYRTILAQTGEMQKQYA